MSATFTRSNFAGLPRENMVPCRSRTRKITSQMSRVEMARVVAEHKGYLTGPGGWIYTSQGRPVCHGYGALAKRLGSALMLGRGIDWTRIH
jgi:hypothetical protein